MLLHKKEQRIKKAKRLQQELNELYTLKWGMKSIPLDEPIFKGYKKYYVLRDDIAKRDDAEAIESLLRRVNTTIYSPTKDFMERTRKKMVSKHHPLRPLYKKEQFSSEEDEKKESQFFESVSKHIIQCGERWSSLWYCHICHADGHTFTRLPIHWHVKCPWIFDTKIEPYYLTHYKPIDCELESRISEISNQMCYHQYWPLLNHANGHGCKSDWDDLRNNLSEEFVMQEQYAR